MHTNADIDPMHTNADIEALTQALKDAATAHHHYEEETGEPDPDWAEWYAGFIVGRLGQLGWSLDRKSR